MWWFYSLNGFIWNIILFLILLKENPINWQLDCEPNEMLCSCEQSMQLLCQNFVLWISRGNVSSLFKKNISSVLKILFLLAGSGECCKEKRPLVARICSVLLAQMKMLAALELHANFRTHTHAHTHAQTQKDTKIQFPSVSVWPCQFLSQSGPEDPK